MRNEVRRLQFCNQAGAQAPRLCSGATSAGVDPMADNLQHERNKAQSASPNTKGNAPRHLGGDARKAKAWGGGNKAAKGPITRAKKRNPNSSAKT
jgi:hypothetical protein